jgi:hypothetical protein
MCGEWRPIEDDDQHPVTVSLPCEAVTVTPFSILFVCIHVRHAVSLVVFLVISAVVLTSLTNHNCLAFFRLTNYLPPAHQIIYTARPVCQIRLSASQLKIHGDCR